MLFRVHHSMLFRSMQELGKGRKEKGFYALLQILFLLFYKGCIIMKQDVLEEVFYRKTSLLFEKRKDESKGK